MKREERLTIILLLIAIIFLGCGNEKKEQKNEIIEKTKEALGSSDETGCNLDGNNTNEECSEKRSASNLILNALDNNKSQTQENSLQMELDNFVEDAYKEKEKKLKSSIKNELQNFVDSTKDREEITNELEDLVNSTKNREEITNELENLVNSTKDRKDIKNELEGLVDSIEKTKSNKDEVKDRLLKLVDNSNKQTSSIENTKESLESLVSSAQKSGTASAKRLASSIIKDVSQHKIKILKTEEKFVKIEVQQGDSLSSLAYKYYGDASKYNVIYEVNKDKINNKKMIYPGTTLLIPKI